MDLELLWRKLPDNGFFRLLRNMVERYFDHGVGRSAAALTYVAAALTSILQLLWLLGQQRD